MRGDIYLDDVRSRDSWFFTVKNWPRLPSTSCWSVPNVFVRGWPIVRDVGVECGIGAHVSAIRTFECTSAAQFRSGSRYLSSAIIANIKTECAVLLRNKEDRVGDTRLFSQF